MYEYIRISLDTGELQALNSLASSGWHMVAMTKENIALLERQIPEDKRQVVEEYYSRPESRGRTK